MVGVVPSSVSTVWGAALACALVQLPVAVSPAWAEDTQPATLCESAVEPFDAVAACIVEARWALCLKRASDGLPEFGTDVNRRRLTSKAVPCAKMLCREAATEASRAKRCAERDLWLERAGLPPEAWPAAPVVASGSTDERRQDERAEEAGGIGVGLTWGGAALGVVAAVVVSALVVWDAKKSDQPKSVVFEGRRF